LIEIPKTGMRKPQPNGCGFSSSFFLPDIDRKEGIQKNDPYKKKLPKNRGAISIS
jgi:hypothetical protein